MRRHIVLSTLASCLFTITALGQTGNYRTILSGNWSDPTTWERDADSNGSFEESPASVAPTNASTAGNITILSGHIVTIVSDLTADQITLQSSATLTINSGIVFTLANGTGTDLTINPTSVLNVSGTFAKASFAVISGTSASNTNFLAGSIYRHQDTSAEGAMPLATWNSASTVEIIGYTSGRTLTPAGNWGQSFGNFTWNCPSQSNLIAFAGLVTSITGTMTIQNTGGRVLQFSSSEAPTMNITGSLNILGTSRVEMSTTGVGAIINVGQDFNFSSTSASGSDTNTSGTCTLNITGSLTMSAGLLRLASVAGTGVCTINLNGDFTIGGTITENAPDPGGAFINFIRNGTQNFSGAGSLLNRIQYTVAAGSTLNVLGESKVQGNAGSSLIVNGALRVGSVNSTGAILNGSGTGNGNIRVMTRTFNSGSSVIYGGVAAQVIGDGHPSAANVGTVIDNASGVSLNVSSTLSNLSLLGNLVLQSGNLIIESNSSVTRTLTVGANITANGNAVLFSGDRSDLVIDGTGDLTIPLAAGTPSLRNLTLNRTGTTTLSTGLTITGAITGTSGTLSLSGTTIVSGGVSLATGSAVRFFNQSLQLNSTFTSTGGTLSPNAGSTLILNGSGVTGTLFFTAASTLGTLTVNKDGAGNVAVLNSAITIGSALNLLDGNLQNTSGLTMASGSTITRAVSGSIAGSLSGASPTGSGYHVTYTGNSIITPGSELLGSIANLTMSNSTTLTLSAPLTISGEFGVTSGIVNTGGNAISAGSLSIATGTLNAPTSTLTLTGNFTNSGVFNATTGTVVFNGTSSVLGASTTTFRNITISGILNAPANLQLVGNFVNHGTFNANGGNLQFIGSTSQILNGTSPVTVSTLTLNNTGSGNALVVSNPTTVTSALTLQDGNLNNASGITFNNGTLLTRQVSGVISGSITGTVPAGTYDVQYSGNTNITSGLELQGSVRNFTSNSTSSVSLNNPLNLTGDLIINSGSFISGVHMITTVGLTTSGTGIFTAPTAPNTLTLLGNISSNGTFNHNNGTVIFNGNTSISGAVTPVFNTIQISNTLNNGAGTTINLRGNFVNNGTLNSSGGGTLLFSGITTQNISGSAVTTFANMTVTNTTNPSVRVESNQNLSGVLTLASNAIFDADGSANTSIFTLLSTDDEPATDASIAALPAGASVLGNVTVQRYMSAEGPDDRFISSPVTNATVAQWQDDFSITGAFPQTSYPCTGCNNKPSMFWYNETVTGTFNNGYTRHPMSSNTETLVPGRGYDAYIMNGASQINIDVTGPINAGTINFTISRTSSTPADPNSDGWNLLGNPFPSAITWNNGGGWTKTDIAPTVYVWDVQANVYRTYNADTQVGDLTGGIIASGQAFWIYANQPGASLSVNEQAKTASTGVFFRNRTANTDFSGYKISLTGLEQNITDNAFLIMANPTEDHVMKGQLDAIKLPGKSLSIALLDKANRMMVTHGVDMEERDLTVPLSVYARQPGVFEISVSPANNGLTQEIYLEDRLENRTVNISLKPYRFVVSSSESFVEGRFLLKTSSESKPEGDEIALYVYPNPATGIIYFETNTPKINRITLHNNIGQQVVEVPSENWNSLGRGEYDISTLPKGLYFLKVVHGGGWIIRKIIKR